ncbi:hypothetical protein OCUBac02_21550 [Bosea sp. ANAM02]|nr:hypothetical protein OCUBac02_21550 [Bosea sp. ANAM02]
MASSRNAAEAERDAGDIDRARPPVTRMAPARRALLHCSESLLCTSHDRAHPVPAHAPDSALEAGFPSSLPRIRGRF